MSDVIAILGMHRSGTSLMSNWLEASGLFVGDNLLGEAESNPNGHFEDLAFLQLHMEDLLQKKMDANGLININSPLYFSPETKLKAKKIISDRNLHHQIWGWKEPRTVLYAEQWLDLIPNLKIIIIKRNDDKVLYSLLRRYRANHNKIRATSNDVVIKIRSLLLSNIYIYYLNKKYRDTIAIYNQTLDKIKKKYPDRVFYVELKDMIDPKKEDGIKDNLNSFINHPQVKMVPLENVYNKDLLK